MDNLKYYNDSFAYDYNRFVESPKKKAEIHSYPQESKKTASGLNSQSKKQVRLAVNIALAVLLILSVCLSLFLRAEISSMRTEINSVNKEIVALESESTRLSVEMERKISVTGLEEAAKALGMQKCEKSQVTYIQTNQVDTAENFVAE